MQYLKQFRKKHQLKKQLLTTTQQMIKLTIIAIALVASALAATAQNKPVSVPTTAPVAKPVYQMDGTKTMTLGGKLTVQQVNDFLVVLQLGLPALESHPQLSGAQITAMKNNYKIVADTITIRYNQFLKADMARFTADTTKQFHTKK